MSRNGVVHGGRETCLSAPEARLLRQINQGFSDAWWERYHELIRKRQEAILTTEEYRELIGLADDAEQRDVKRVRALVKLAKLRKQTLSGLMKALGLPEGTDA